MNTALLLVDIQQDYFPGGKMEVTGALEASMAAKRLLNYFRGEHLPVVHIQHISMRAGATFFLPDTDGITIHENVQPVPDEIIIQKYFPNSFRDTDLQKHLEAKDVNELVICGMMSQMCIDATVRAAFDEGYSCVVAHDACAARHLAFNGMDIPATHIHGAYMAALSAVYAKVLSADEIIETLRNT